MKTAQAAAASQAFLDRCAQEPVHLIGSIQPYGVLFALSEPDLVVRQVSANVGEICGIAAELVLGCSFEAVLGKRQFECFQAQLDSGHPLDVAVGRGRIHAQCMTHRHDGVLIVELEMRGEAGPIPGVDIDTHIRGPLLRLQQAADIVDLASVAAAEFRRLTGFERVIIYQFEEDWSGNVIAESVDAVPVAYLGLLDSFLGDFASQLDTLGKAFAEKNGPGARMEAHALKGSAATVSAVSLSAVALEMETAAGAGELERFGELLPRAAEEFERFQGELTLVGWR